MSKSGYALITGASSGIGEQLAYCFARDGIPLILVARNNQQLERVKNNISQKNPVDVHIYSADLAVHGNPQKLYKWTQEQNLPVSYVVNNAGFGDQADVNEADVTRLEDMINLNVTALVTLSKLYGTAMATAGHGTIVNISSVAGFVPGPGMAVYYATKSFVLSFSQALAAELEPHNVQVTTVCPAATESNFAIAARAEKSQLFNRKLPSSEDVAKFAYKAMKDKKLVAIWGFSNRVMTRIVGLAPRRQVLAAVRRIQS